MELTYTKVGDYYIPDLALDDGAEYEIGTYGRMRQRFLEEHHHGTYTSLLLTGKLWKHLADIDTACDERMDFLISAMASQTVFPRDCFGQQVVFVFGEIADHLRPETSAVELLCQEGFLFQLTATVDFQEVIRVNIQDVGA